MGNQEPLRQEETEKMQKPPQIIVIPQSMLAGQKSLLRLAPSPMPRNTSPLLSTNPRPVAAVVGSKRPAPSPSPKDFLLDIKEKKRKMPMKRQQGRGPTWTTSAPRRGC